MTNQPLVRLSGNRLITTSLAVSHAFGKKHKDVLRAIQLIECSAEFNRRNFAPVSYTDGKGEQRPAYEITRDGFVFLCMGFTGAQAAVWKEKYIAAFNSLEAEVVARLAPGYAGLPQQLERLKAAYLAQNPAAADLLRYRALNLKQTEIARLLGISTYTVRQRLKELTAIGLADYTPDARQVSAGKKGNAVRRALSAQQAQLPLPELDLAGGAL